MSNTIVKNYTNITEQQPRQTPTALQVTQNSSEEIGSAITLKNENKKKENKNRAGKNKNSKLQLAFQDKYSHYNQVIKQNKSQLSINSRYQTSNNAGPDAADEEINKLSISEDTKHSLNVFLSVRERYKSSLKEDFSTLQVIQLLLEQYEHQEYREATKDLAKWLTDELNRPGQSSQMQAFMMHDKKIIEFFIILREQIATLLKSVKGGEGLKPEEITINLNQLMKNEATKRDWLNFINYIFHANRRSCSKLVNLLSCQPAQMWRDAMYRNITLQNLRKISSQSLTPADIYAKNYSRVYYK